MAKGGQPICRWLEEWKDIAKKNGLGEKDIKIPLELLKLYNLGMKLPAGTPKHKEVMKKIDKLRKDIKEEIKYQLSTNPNVSGFYTDADIAKICNVNCIIANVNF